MNTVEKTQVELGPVQETLLIPLLGRAYETQKKRGIGHHRYGDGRRTGQP